jgi:hypothetical protein
MPENYSQSLSLKLVSNQPNFNKLRMFLVLAQMANLLLSEVSGETTRA